MRPRSGPDFGGFLGMKKERSGIFIQQKVTYRCGKGLWRAGFSGSFSKAAGQKPSGKNADESGTAMLPVTVS